MIAMVKNISLTLPLSTRDREDFINRNEKCDGTQF